MKQRKIVPELMDDPQISPADHQQALAGLARLNRWSRGVAGLWQVLRREAKTDLSRPLRVLDLATGSGDLPIRLMQRARREQLLIAFSACDISETALAVAREKSRDAGVSIDFFTLDAVRDPIPAGFDVIICSLFLHHLTDTQAFDLLQNMGRSANKLIIVNDLHRSRINAILVRIASRVFSRSPIVHFDGPVSVRAAFTQREALDLATRAGLTNAKIFSHFPCRWLLTWRKPT